MEINKNNYEAFFLDYHEGNLTPLQVADLFLFIAQHPEFKDEFESFENLSLEDLSCIEFEDKSDLKKEITLLNKDEYFIRSVENTLNTAEKELLQKFLIQHPQLLHEFELFQKSIIPMDDFVVFENKSGLKKSLSSGKFVNMEEDRMISAIEGLLSPQETKLFDQQIVDDVKLKKEFTVYLQTKLVADISLVFEEKEKLKRKIKRAIPLYYYISAAAAILALVGLFFLFQHNDIQPKLAGVVPEKLTNAQNSLKGNDTIENKVEKKEIQSAGIAAFVVKNEKLNKIKNIQKKPKFAATDEVPNLTIIVKKEYIKPTAIPNEPLVIELVEEVQPSYNSIINAQVDKEPVKTIEFISLRELAVEKIKEELLDKNAIVAQKKSGRLKKISGWDIAQVFTSGISKLTGRDLELKPFYNDEGNVTAYAISAGDFQISRGR